MRHLLAALALAAPLAAAEPFFRDGDRPIVFLGDSITEQAYWTTAIETWLLVRHPEWKLTFRNAGWSGDGATMWTRGGLDNGLPRDVLAHKPAALLVDYGMNDARGGEHSLPAFTAGLTEIVRRGAAAGARVAVLSPSPEEREQAGEPAGSAYNRMLARYAESARAIAGEAAVPWVDQLAPFIAVIEAGRASGQLASPRDLIPDAVHPEAAGGLIMAASVLRGLGETPAVSRLEIDHAAGTVVAEGCDGELLDEPAADPERRTLRVRDHVLPWPLRREAMRAFALPKSPAAGMEDHRLIVRGLAPGRWQVLVDDRVALTRSAEELAAGIDRALLRGPGDQSARLLEAVEAKNRLVFTRWRQVQVYPIPAWLAGDDNETKRAAEMARLDARIAEAEAAIEPLRRAEPYRLTIALAPPARPLALRAEAGADGVDLAWRLPDPTTVASVIERAGADGVFTELARVPAPTTTHRDAGAPAGARYRVRAVGPKVVSPPSLAAEAGPAGGFAASYFRGTALAGAPLAQRVDPIIDMSWTTMAAPPAGPVEFSARWSGLLARPAGGRTVLTVTSDDGVRVWLDGVQVIDEWRGQAPTEFSAELPAGDGPVEVVIEYYQGNGGAVTQLAWRTGDAAKTVVPAEAVRPLFDSALSAPASP